MLQKSYLKLIAASIVCESNLSKYAKIQVFRFIENEASELQLTIFINEGKIQKVSEAEITSEIAPIAVVAVSLITAAAFAVGKSVYNKFYSNVAKACAGRDRDDKKRCIRDFKLKANYARLGALKKEMGKCNETNNVKKCRNNFLKHMRKIEKQIQKDRVF
jgi:hypothetical protein